MKNNRMLIRTAWTLFFVPALLVSCAFGFEPSQNRGGSIAIRVAAPPPVRFAAVLPDNLTYTWRLTGTGPEQNGSMAEEGTITLTNLVPGPRRIEITALLDGGPYGFGSKDFTIKAGETVKETVVMKVTGGDDDTTPPAEASGPAAVPSTGELMLTWTNPSDADFDHVEITWNDGSPQSVSVSGAPGAAGFYVIPGLTDGEPYSVTLKTLDTSGNSSAGTSITGTPNPLSAAYVKEGGTGSGAAWAAASGDLQKMIDQVSAAREAGLPGPYIVRVAAGTYRPQYAPASDGTTDPAPTDPRDLSFILRDGVEIRGGYPAAAAGATPESARDPAGAANKTILSGDIDNNDGPGGAPAGITGSNAYHVVVALAGPTIGSIGYGTVLDGFTIRGGNADGIDDLIVDGTRLPRNGGGGICVTARDSGGKSCTPVFTNIILSGNKGNAGAGIANATTSPILIQVEIRNNESNGGGGGVDNNLCPAPGFINVTIAGNIANGPSSPIDNGGGGMWSYASSPVLINALVSGNKAVRGGGLYSTYSNPAKLINVTIAGNHATASSGGGGIGAFAHSGSQVIRNSIIWGNTAGADISGITTSPTITGSIVEGKADTTNGNIDYSTVSDPFETPDGEILAAMPNPGAGYRLRPGSPALNSGDDALYPGTWAKWTSHSDIPAAWKESNFETVYERFIKPALEKDLAGTPRKNGIIDMGAYEYHE